MDLVVQGLWGHTVPGRPFLRGRIGGVIRLIRCRLRRIIIRTGIPLRPRLLRRGTDIRPDSIDMKKAR